MYADTNFGPAKKITEVSSETRFEAMYGRLVNFNSTLANHLRDLEEWAHKLENTRTPEKENDQSPSCSNGILDDNANQLSYYHSHLERLESIIAKLKGLI